MQKIYSSSYFKQYWKCYRLWGSDSNSEKLKIELEKLRNIEKINNIVSSFKLITKEELESKVIPIYRGKQIL